MRHITKKQSWNSAGGSTDVKNNGSVDWVVGSAFAKAGMGEGIEKKRQCAGCLRRKMGQSLR